MQRLVDLLIRRSGFVAGIGLLPCGEGLEHQCGVADCAGHRAHMVHGRYKLHDTCLADQPVGRLVPDNAAALRGQADGTTRVGAERGKGHPSRHGYRRTAAGSARMMVRPPWIPDGAEERVNRGRAERQLVQSGLAQGDGARGAQSRDHGRVLVGHMPGVVPGPVRGQYAPGVDEVLDRHRDAVQGAAIRTGCQLAVRLPGLRECLIGGHGNERIQKPVQKLDACQGRPCQFQGRRLPGPNCRGGLRQRRVLESIHRSSFLPLESARILRHHGGAGTGMARRIV